MISQLIKQKIVDEGESATDFVAKVTQRAGKPLRIAVNSKYEKNVSSTLLISVDVMQKIKVSLNLTQNKTTSLASKLRTAARKRKLIEPNLKEHLSADIHCEDDFFEVKVFDFVFTKDNKTTNISRNILFCKNLKSCVKYVTHKRDVVDPRFKIGLDGGGGFLKLCLSIQSADNDPVVRRSSRQKYSDGVASKRFRDSGVKKLFILAITESTQENYHNVKLLWSSLNIDLLGGTVAVDLKLANILCGIMTHSSTYPCTWCYSKCDQLHTIGELRTVGS